MKKLLAMLLMFVCVTGLCAASADAGPPGADMIAIVQGTWEHSWSRTATPPPVSAHADTYEPPSSDYVDPSSLDTQMPEPVVTNKPEYKYLIGPLQKKPPAFRAPDIVIALLSEEGFRFIKNPDTTVTIVGYENKNAKTINVPGIIKGPDGLWYHVSAIAPYAFSDPNGGISPFGQLTNVTISDTVKEIGEGAFRNCPALEEVKLPENLTKLSKLTFYGCKKLRKINIPKHVKSIETAAFEGCDALKELTVPDGVERIEAGVFANCGRLEKVILPAGNIAIADIAIENSPKVTVYVYKDSKAHKYAIKNKIPFVLIDAKAADDKKTAKPEPGSGWLYTLDVNGNATIIGHEDKAAHSFAIPSEINLHRVVAIGEFAFSSQTSAKSPYFYLVSVVIPDSVADIYAGAFSGCGSLREVTLPRNLGKISADLFNGCGKLNGITIPHRVNEIGAAAFKNCDSLTEITLPGSMKVIEREAFASCDNLSKVTLPASAELIRTGAFRDCTRLETVILNTGGVDFENDVFTNCGRLTLHVIKYSKTHDYAVNNDIPFKFIEAQMSDETPEAETAGDVQAEDDTQEGRTISFYIEPEGMGEAVIRGAGFTAYYVEDMGFDDDALSSIRINDDGLYVRLYEHSELSGACLVLQGEGLYDLRELHFDSIVSSYVISK